MITLMGIFAMAARFSVGSDTWWHLAAGRMILEKGQILQIDPFSYTRAGAEWHYPGWLAEIGLYAVYQILGAGGLNILTALIVTAAFGLIWFSLQGNFYLRAFLLVLAAAASGVYWAARPYLITFLFSALYIVFLEREWEWWRSGHEGGTGGLSHGGRGLWILPLVMVFWANSHGGFAVGFILYGIYFLGILGRTNLLADYFQVLKSRELHWKEKAALVRGKTTRLLEGFALSLKTHLRWRRFVLVGLVMVAAVALNPFGPEMLLYPFKTIGIDALGSYIDEWQPPNFHEIRILPFLLLLGLTFGFVGASRDRISWKDFLLVGVFGTLALTAARNIALFALISPVVISRAGVNAWAVLREDADWLSSSRQSESRLNQVINFSLLLLTAAAVLYKVSLVYPVSANKEYFQQVFPVDAVNYLEKEDPQGRLFNSYNWGGYLIWELPEKPVFVDGRTDLYGDELIGEWVEVVQAEENWLEILRDWNVEVILLEPDRPVVRLLSENDWDLRYQDSQAVIFTK